MSEQLCVLPHDVERLAQDGHYLCPSHDGPHRRYAEPERPAIEWARPRVITLTEWIRERISL